MGERIEPVNISNEHNVGAATNVATTVEDLVTPCLLLDQFRMMRNVTRLRQRLQSFGVPLRPHLKTFKSIDVAKKVVDPLAGGASVSTLREAEEFSSAGIRDL